jgi:2-oxoglutarate ferredoxin oxidoreductase subunit alpha
MQEGISYLAGADLPAVIVNVMRGGPGLGNIAPAQGDYFQATRGGGHGDYRTLVLAGWSVQELYHLTRLAFDLADRYRGPVLVLGDAVLGQMMEPVVLPADVVDPASLPSKPWATNGARGRPRNVINSLYIYPPDLEKVNARLQARYAQAKAEEIRYEAEDLDDAEVAIVAYGTAARVAVTAIREARAGGLRVGLFRPVSLFPFPYEQIASLARRMRAILVVELSLGQMVDDVRLAVGEASPVYFHGRSGGMVVTPAEVHEALLALPTGG